jgi:L-asparaginase
MMSSSAEVFRALTSQEPIAVVTTGGTIDKVYFDDLSDFEVGKSMLGELLVQAQVSASVEVVELMRKDSLELTDEDRRLIRDTVATLEPHRVVITHGTDTMVDTARELAVITDKVIVLTGSFAPARFAKTDAIFNVGLAFGAVQTAQAGVYIAMNGRIFSAGRVFKNRQTMRFEEK